MEAESKLKQVYIPNYTKEENKASSKISSSNTCKSSTHLNSNIMAQSVSAEITVMTNNNSNDVITVNGGKPCESCSETISPHVS